MKLATASHFFGVCLAFGLASVAIGSPPPQPRQAGDTPWLARTLAAQEAALSRAYNDCRLHRLRAYMLQGAFVAEPDGRRVDPMKEARERICGRMRRDVVAESLVVRPIGNTGALVAGQERFCPVGEAFCAAPPTRFLAQWARYDGAWRVAWIRRLAVSAIERAEPADLARADAREAMRVPAPR